VLHQVFSRRHEITFWHPRVVRGDGLWRSTDSLPPG
jgi:hypothetical protein